MYIYTVPAQIERRRSNFRPEVFGAVAFKFEPKITVIIKNFVQKVDFLTKCCSNQDCRSICAGTVCTSNRYYYYLFLLLLF